jgi:hypothetical protein
MNSRFLSKKSKVNSKRTNYWFIIPITYFKVFNNDEDLKFTYPVLFNLRNILLSIAANKCCG